MMILAADRRLILGLVFFFLLFMVICVAQRQPIIETERSFPMPPNIPDTTSPTVDQEGGAQSPEEHMIIPKLQIEASPQPHCLNDKRYSSLGYDNPYIFPYQNALNVNLNYPTSRYRYPHWYRQIKLEATNYQGFPGYFY